MQHLQHGAPAGSNPRVNKDGRHVATGAAASATNVGGGDPAIDAAVGVACDKLGAHGGATSDAALALGGMRAAGAGDVVGSAASAAKAAAAIARNSAFQLTTAEGLSLQHVVDIIQKSTNPQVTKEWALKWIECCQEPEGQHVSHSQRFKNDHKTFPHEVLPQSLVTTVAGLAKESAFALGALSDMINALVVTRPQTPPAYANLLPLEESGRLFPHAALPVAGSPRSSLQKSVDEKQLLSADAMSTRKKDVLPEAIRLISQPSFTKAQRQSAVKFVLAVQAKDPNALDYARGLPQELINAVLELSVHRWALFSRGKTTEAAGLLLNALVHGLDGSASTTYEQFCEKVAHECAAPTNGVTVTTVAYDKKRVTDLLEEKTFNKYSKYIADSAKLAQGSSASTSARQSPATSSLSATSGSSRAESVNTQAAQLVSGAGVASPRPSSIGSSSSDVGTVRAVGWAQQLPEREVGKYKLPAVSRSSSDGSLDLDPPVSRRGSRISSLSSARKLGERSVNAEQLFQQLLGGLNGEHHVVVNGVEYSGKFEGGVFIGGPNDTRTETDEHERTITETGVFSTATGQLDGFGSRVITEMQDGQRVVLLKDEGMFVDGGLNSKGQSVLPTTPNQRTLADGRVLTGEFYGGVLKGATSTQRTILDNGNIQEIVGTGEIDTTGRLIGGATRTTTVTTTGGGVVSEKVEEGLFDEDLVIGSIATTEGGTKTTIIAGTKETRDANSDTVVQPAVIGFSGGRAVAGTEGKIVIQTFTTATSQIVDRTVTRHGVFAADGVSFSGAGKVEIENADGTRIVNTGTYDVNGRLAGAGGVMKSYDSAGRLVDTRNGVFDPTSEELTGFGTVVSTDNNGVTTTTKSAQFVGGKLQGKGESVTVDSNGVATSKSATFRNDNLQGDGTIVVTNRSGKVVSTTTGVEFIGDGNPTGTSVTQTVKLADIIAPVVHEGSYDDAHQFQIRQSTWEEGGTKKVGQLERDTNIINFGTKTVSRQLGTGMAKEVVEEVGDFVAGAEEQLHGPAPDGKVPYSRTTTTIWERKSQLIETCTGTFSLGQFEAGVKAVNSPAGTTTYQGHFNAEGQLDGGPDYWMNVTGSDSKVVDYRAGSFVAGQQTSGQHAYSELDADGNPVEITITGSTSNSFVNGLIREGIRVTKKVDKNDPSHTVTVTRQGKFGSDGHYLIGQGKITRVEVKNGVTTTTETEGQLYENEQLVGTGWAVLSMPLDTYANSAIYDHAYKSQHPVFYDPDTCKFYKYDSGTKQIAELPFNDRGTSEEQAQLLQQVRSTTRTVISHATLGALLRGYDLADKDTVTTTVTKAGTRISTITQTGTFVRSDSGVDVLFAGTEVVDRPVAAVTNNRSQELVSACTIVETRTWKGGAFAGANGKLQSDTGGNIGTYSRDAQRRVTGQYRRTLEDGTILHGRFNGDEFQTGDIISPDGSHTQILERYPNGTVRCDRQLATPESIVFGQVTRLAGQYDLQNQRLLSGTQEFVGDYQIAGVWGAEGQPILGKLSGLAFPTEPYGIIENGQVVTLSEAEISAADKNPVLRQQITGNARLRAVLTAVGQTANLWPSSGVPTKAEFLGNLARYQSVIEKVYRDMVAADPTVTMRDVVTSMALTCCRDSGQTQMAQELRTSSAATAVRSTANAPSTARLGTSVSNAALQSSRSSTATFLSAPSTARLSAAARGAQVVVGSLEEFEGRIAKMSYDNTFSEMQKLVAERTRLLVDASASQRPVVSQAPLSHAAVGQSVRRLMDAQERTSDLELALLPGIFAKIAALEKRQRQLEAETLNVAASKVKNVIAATDKLLSSSRAASGSQRPVVDEAGVVTQLDQIIAASLEIEKLLHNPTSRTPRFEVVGHLATLQAKYNDLVGLELRLLSPSASSSSTTAQRGNRQPFRVALQAKREELAASRVTASAVLSASRDNAVVSNIPSLVAPTINTSGALKFNKDNAIAWWKKKVQDNQLLYSPVLAFLNTRTISALREEFVANPVGANTSTAFKTLADELRVQDSKITDAEVAALIAITLHAHRYTMRTEPDSLGTLRSAIQSEYRAARSDSALGLETNAVSSRRRLEDNNSSRHLAATTSSRRLNDNDDGALSTTTSSQRALRTVSQRRISSSKRVAATTNAAESSQNLGNDGALSATTSSNSKTVVERTRIRIVGPAPFGGTPNVTGVTVRTVTSARRVPVRESSRNLGNDGGALSATTSEPRRGGGTTSSAVSSSAVVVVAKPQQIDLQTAATQRILAAGAQSKDPQLQALYTTLKDIEAAQLLLGLKPRENFVQLRSNAQRRNATVESIIARCGVLGVTPQQSQENDNSQVLA